jgi:hypothetical protein
MAGDSMRFGASSRTWVFEGGPDREEIAKEDPIAKLAQQTKSSSPSNTVSESDSIKSKSVSKAFVNAIPQAKRRFSQTKSIKDDDDDVDAEDRLEAQLARKSSHEKHVNNDEEEDLNVSDEERDNAELEMVAGYLGREAIEGADGEDSFYDRTLEMNNGKRNTAGIWNRPETYETLGAKIRVLTFVISAVKERISALNQIISNDISRRNSSTVGGGGGDDDEEVDALDAFISGMSQTVEEEEERDKKMFILKELEKELRDYQTIEEQLKPQPGDVIASLVSASELDSLSDQFYNDLVERVKKTGGILKLHAKSVVPEPKRSKLSDIPSTAVHTTLEPPSKSHVSQSLPNEIYDRPSSSSSPPHLPSPQEALQSKPSENFKKPSVSAHSMTTTLNIIQNTKKRERPTPSYDDEGEDDTYSTWQAPQNQSGDGTTSLNAKYGY